MLRFVWKIRKPTQSELLSIDIKKQAAKASRRRSRSRSPSNSREKAFGAKSSLLQSYKFWIFSPLESKTKVVAIEEPMKGKEILDRYSWFEDMEKMYENAFAAEPHLFDFDSVVDENFRKEKLYVLHIKGLIKRSMKGENTWVVLFGPTEEHSSGILKYTNGKEKGILGRTIEDILEFRDLYGYNKLSIVINAYQIYLERIEDLLSESKNGKKQGQKTPQIVKVADPENHQLVDQVMNLSERLITKGKDIISVVQEISKNRSKFATKCYGVSVEEMKRKSHLVVTLSLYSDYGKPTENKISDIMLIELCGSEQAAVSFIFIF